MSSATSWASVSGRLIYRLDLDVAAGQVLQLARQLVDLGALLADDHADAGRVDEHHHLLARPLDLDLGDLRTGVLPLDVLAELDVLDQQVREVLLAGVPVGLPVGHDAGAKASRSNFLPHANHPSSSATVT
jgi:hypothetical protein